MADVNDLAMQYELRNHQDAEKPIGLRPPLDGLRMLSGWCCNAPNCNYMTSSDREVTKHQKSHNTGLKSEMIACALQTFFSPNQSGYIRVTEIPPPVATTLVKDEWTILQQIKAEDSASYNPPIIDQTDAKALHPFAHHSGFAGWLGNMQWAEVEKLKTLSKSTVQMRADCAQLIEDMFALCTERNVYIRRHIHSPT